jgi:hypothetical protein
MALTALNVGRCCKDWWFGAAPASCRKSWARMIQKIYEVDPLICPKCRGTMRIISIIEDREIVKTILQHLGLWPIRSRPPAKAHALPSCEYATDDACQTAFPDNAACGNPDYPWRPTYKTKRRVKMGRQKWMSA